MRPDGRECVGHFVPRHFRVFDVKDDILEMKVLAGLSQDGRELVLVVSNYKSADGRIELVLQNLSWTGPSASELLLLDQLRNLERIRKEEHHDRSIKIVRGLPAPGILLVHVRPSPSRGDSR